MDKPTRISLKPFSPIGTSDEWDLATAQNAGLLRDVFWVFLATATLYLIGALTFPSEVPRLTLIVAFSPVYLITAISFAILKRGHINRATLFYVASHTLIQVGAVLSHGLRPYSTIAVVNLLLLCSFIIGSRSATAYGLFIAPFASLALYAENQGLIPLQQIDSQSVQNVAIFTCMIGTTFLVNIVIQRQRGAYADRVQAEKDLRQQIKREQHLTLLAGDLGLSQTRRGMIARTCEALHQREGAWATVYWEPGIKDSFQTQFGANLESSHFDKLIAQITAPLPGEFRRLPDAFLHTLSQSNLGGHFTPIPQKKGMGTGMILILSHATAEQQLAGLPYFQAIVGLLRIGLDRLDAVAKTQSTERLEAVGRLAGGIAHDFNNYLTTIMGNAERIKGHLVEKHPSQIPLDHVMLAADRAAALVQKLLLFAKSDSRQLESMDLVAHLRSLQPLLASSLDPKIHFEYTLPLGTLWAKIDPTALEQVVFNLVLNAQDAILDDPHQHGKTQGQIHLRLDHFLDEDTGPWAQLKVQDNGMGIAPEIQGHLFEPFFSTKDPSKGSGLGLATVYGCLQSAGGSIDVDSESGKGSTFLAHFPLTQVSSEVEDTPVKIRLPNGLNAQLDGVHLLLVEDEIDVQRTVKAMLESVGARVLVANNGREGLDQLEQHPRIQIVLTDLTMPEMNGIELLRQMRTLKIQLPVVIMTGYSTHEIELEEDPLLLHMGKPLRLQKLVETLIESLSRT